MSSSCNMLLQTLESSSSFFHALYVPWPCCCCKHLSMVQTRERCTAKPVHHWKPLNLSVPSMVRSHADVCRTLKNLAETMSSKELQKQTLQSSRDGQKMNNFAPNNQPWCAWHDSVVIGCWNYFSFWLSLLDQWGWSETFWFTQIKNYGPNYNSILNISTFLHYDGSISAALWYLVLEYIYLELVLSA